MSQKVANKVDDKSSKELPPPRQGKAVRHDVDLPLENTSLSTVVYWVAGGVLLYLAYYSLVIFQWKTDAGGWMNLALGRQATPDTSTNVPFGAGTKFEHGTPSSDTAGKLLESRINELAEQLGIQGKDLVAAIKPLLPPIKASALYAHPEATGTLVDILADKPKATGVLAGGLGLNNVVGMDEPPSDME